jgi:hypothetical protein
MADILHRIGVEASTPEKVYDRSPRWTACPAGGRAINPGK